MITRRKFVAAGAAALAVVAAPGGTRVFAAESALSDAALTRLGAWLRVGRDGFVDVYTGKVEIGMGVITGLAMVVAEELDIPLGHVRMVTGDTARTPDQGGVGGSTSTQLGSRPLINAAAEARRILLDAAAARLNVPRELLFVSAGVIRHRTDQVHALSYGELVEAIANEPQLALSGEGFSVNVKGAAKPKDPSQYTLVGTPVARMDVASKAFGSARYIVDMRVPGMLHARVVRPPAVGVRPLSVDTRALQAHGDARLVRVGDLLAVVASREWDAVAAARALKVHWSDAAPVFPPMAGLAQAMWAAPVASSDKVIASGDLAAALASGTLINATYAWPFQAHASMGPGCALADVRPAGETTIWVGTQKPFSLRAGLADLLQIPQERVRVVFMQDAGSYGRAGFDDAAADAALLSKAVGKPVRVQWMRHDMTEWGPKAPAIVGRARGAVRDGKIIGLDLTVRAFNGGEISSRPDSAGNFLGGQLSGRANTQPRVEYPIYGKNSAAYAIPAIHAIAELVAPLAPLASPLRTTHLRDPEGPGTTFIVESFIDELAALAQADPLEFRIAHLSDDRQIAVLRAVARAAGWQSRPAGAWLSHQPHHTGRGVAFATRGDTVVATIAHVDVNVMSGKVRVTQLVCAHDCGLIVNPRALRGTIEANLMQSLSRTLYEQVSFDASRVTSHDWATYPVLRTPDVPDHVAVVLIDHKDLPPYGAGEPASRPTAAAVANAVFDATGARVRQAPLTQQNVLAAISAAQRRT